MLWRAPWRRDGVSHQCRGLGERFARVKFILFALGVVPFLTLPLFWQEEGFGNAVADRAKGICNGGNAPARNRCQLQTNRCIIALQQSRSSAHEIGHARFHPRFMVIQQIQAVVARKQGQQRIGHRHKHGVDIRLRTCPSRAQQKEKGKKKSFHRENIFELERWVWLSHKPRWQQTKKSG